MMIGAKILTWSIIFSLSFFTVANATTVTTVINDNGLDNLIVSSVYQKYQKDSALIGTDLKVTSENGVVTISGDVTAQSQADQAMLLVKSIPGVKDVRSEINVKTNPKPVQAPKVPNY